MSKAPRGLSQEQVNLCLATGDVLPIHMAIWTELGILNHQNPIACSQKSADTDNTETQSNTTFDGFQESEISQDSSKEMTRVSHAKEESRASSELGIEDTTQNQINNTLDDSDAFNDAASTPATEQSFSDRPEPSFAQRWALLVIAAYRTKWNAVIKDIENRTLDGDDDDDAWNEMQDLLDMYEDGALDGLA